MQSGREAMSLKIFAVQIFMVSRDAQAIPEFGGGEKSEAAVRVDFGDVCIGQRAASFAGERNEQFADIVAGFVNDAHGVQDDNQRLRKR